MDHKRDALTAVVIPLICVALVAVGASACGDSDGLRPPLWVPDTTESPSYPIGGDELLSDSQSGRTPTVTAPLVPGAPRTGVAATTPAVPPPPGAPRTEVAATPTAPMAEGDQNPSQPEPPIPEEGVADDIPEEPTSTDTAPSTPEVP